ncbi:hypothetical protein BGZ60DRAFT_420994 [Tricladium varicosporioides]|nr:hypothetical protein BGZ60DRAFT_420994 [Hymenoscyphus varicosporioides]
MSIQKITGALISQSLEPNFSLATVNIDFSLVKNEAPAEFKPLRQELTATRRTKAEDGIPHITARKLGALFQNWIPRIPHLIRAYGRRAVEIAQSREANPKATTADGIFAEHVGIDATSIWAAATSGSHAIPLHLLACMLARIFSVSEAIAIWAELVFERKKELAEIDDTDPLFEQSQHLSRISIPREDLGEWDASARSWLQSADQANVKKQKQLMLIINNVSAPVGTSPILFQDVRRVWESTMVAIDSLIQGIPQSVESGAVLLGLSSWHIYPDILVLGDKQPSAKHVKQDDALVCPGGILTIGLHIESTNHSGIYWSLPLANLRYYGGPVITEKSLDTQGNHITILQLLQVAVGCLTQTWTVEKMRIVTFILQLWEYVAPVAHTHTDYPTSYWFGFLAQAMEPLQDMDHSLSKKQGLQLMSYGARRCPNFLGSQSLVPPLFGINNLTTLLSLLDTAEDGIDIIRGYAQPQTGKRKFYLIRYAYGSGNFQSYTSKHEYATVFKLSRDSKKRTLEDAPSQAAGHIRWVTTMTDKNRSQGGKLPEFKYDNERVKLYEDRGETAFPVEAELITSLGEGQQRFGFRWEAPPAVLMREYPEFDPKLNKYSTNETYGLFDDNSFGTVDVYEKDTRYIDFELVAGNPYEVALFECKAVGSIRDSKQVKRAHDFVPLDLVMTQLRKSTISRERMLRYLSDFVRQESRQELLLSMRALATVLNIYKMLPNSLVSLSVTSHCLCDMLWIPKHSPPSAFTSNFRFSAFPMSIGRTFACVALFEFGTCAVNPDMLESVMAMAVGDSIYIAAALLCDPIESPSPYEVRRITGNIGKSGIAMLIPPKNIKKEHCDFDWRVVNHNTFDGRIDNSFQSTSLHLRFTDYILPIDVGEHGLRDFEIYFLESVVSVHDRGKWIADLDILSGLRSVRLERIVPFYCVHNLRPDSPATELIGNSNLATIDNWNEILDFPNKASIVRSAGNWLGRLATVSFSVQHGHPTIILPDRLCWDCVCEVWQNFPANIRLRSNAMMTATGGECLESILSGENLQMTRGSDEQTLSLATKEVAHWNTIKNEWEFRYESVIQPTVPPPTQLGTDDILQTMSDLVIIC